jgi:hypothetical protein
MRIDDCFCFCLFNNVDIQDRVESILEYCIRTFKAQFAALLVKVGASTFSPSTYFDEMVC